RVAEVPWFLVQRQQHPRADDERRRGYDDAVQVGASQAAGHAQFARDDGQKSHGGGALVLVRGLIIIGQGKERAAGRRIWNARPGWLLCAPCTCRACRSLFVSSPRKLFQPRPLWKGKVRQVSRRWSKVESHQASKSCSRIER